MLLYTEDIFQFCFLDNGEMHYTMWSYQVTYGSTISFEIICVGELYVAELSVGEMSVGEMFCRRNVRWRKFDFFIKLLFYIMLREYFENFIIILYDI